MFIVKLGGSVITDKSEYFSFREETTRKIIRTLAVMDEPMVLVHGAGSFGHIKAKEFGLPGKISNRSLRGFSIVHNDVMALNQRIMNELIAAGFNAVSVPPVSTFSSRSNYSAMDRLVENGITAVSHGDCYLSGDSVNIVSGDRIVRELAERYRPTQVIFLSDVDGIYNRNPKEFEDATLISSLEDVVEFSETADDVTGGMEGKLGEMKSIARYCDGVYLINGNYPERIGSIGSSDFVGTAIRYQRTRKK